jgi:DNA uptake protein ComE-like DNA-binding protein
VRRHDATEQILLYEVTFEKIEDIKNVEGIGDKTFEKLKDHIRV